MVKCLPIMWETQVHSLDREEKSPGEGNGNPLQYLWLENPMDREAGRKESDMTERFHFHFHC